MTRATFPPALRRNWGFHDGRLARELRRFPAWSDAERFCARHFDRAYARGFLAGYESTP